jgi:hypothetical protein
VAPHTTAPASVIVTATVTGSGSGTLFVLIAPSNPAVANVTNVVIGNGNTGQGTVVPGSPANLAKRAHAATITVLACTNDPTCQTNQIVGSPATINVTYNVGGIDVSTPTLVYNVGNAPTPADLAKTFDVTGHLVPSWTATTNAPWLSLAPTTGVTTSPTTVTASLIQSEIDTRENGSYSGTITVTPSEGTPRTINAALILQRTRVNYVAPYVARANVADEVIIRGENFTQFTPTSVEFGPGNVATFTVDSNTQIRATHPALPAGAYDVRVINSAGAAPTRARLVVVDATAYTQEFLQYPVFPGGPFVVTPTSLIYDAERRALMVGLDRNGLTRLTRFAYTGAWNLPTDVSIPSLNPGAFTAAALSTEGRTVFVAYDDTATFRFALAEHDPVTLAQTKITHYSAEIEGQSIAVANNGLAIIKTERACCTGSFPVLSYNPLNPSIILVQNPFATLDSTGIGGSGDGSQILVPTDDPGSPLVTALLRYSSEQGTLFDTTGDIESVSPRLVLNRRGTHFVYQNLSGNRILATAPPGMDVGTLLAGTLDAAFSPTANIVYGYDSTETLTAYDRATGLPLATGLSIAGTGSLAALVTVSPDGGTVFVAGNLQLAVVPAALVPQ